MCVKSTKGAVYRLEEGVLVNFATGLGGEKVVEEDCRWGRRPRKGEMKHEIRHPDQDNSADLPSKVHGAKVEERNGCEV